MKGLLWPLPEGDTAREWARLARSEDVQAFLTLIAAERQNLLELLATVPEDDARTWIQGQIAALGELPTFCKECEAAVRHATEQDPEGEEDEHGRRRSWLRRRIEQFRGV